MMKKISTFLLVFAFFTFAFFSNVNVSASTGASMVDGASIRTVGTQGLKFEATFDESLNGVERGFFLAYGEATLSQLEAVIDDEIMMLNGKVVFNTGTVNYDKLSRKISVVLTDIPISAYANKITVFGYAFDGTNYTFVPAGVTRSIAEVAFNAGNAGDASVQDVLTEIKANYFKVNWTKTGNYEVSGIYEYNHIHLRTEFLKDWKSYTGSTMTELTPADFFATAKTGAISTSNLSESWIYRFFNDAEIKAKWGWFLDYIKSVDGTTHPTRQIVAIQGDGTNGTYNLYFADHLSYSICNFFNYEAKVGGYTAINFIDSNGIKKYETIKNYNNSVYISQTNHSLFKLNDSFTFPLVEKAGYHDIQYKSGEITYNPGDIYQVKAPVISPITFTSIYTPIDYQIKYYDDTMLLTELTPNKYTIEVATTLPNYIKEGYSFNGWYENRGFTGEPVTTIPKGSIGDKTYYAKMTESAFVEVNVTYNLNGGQLNSTDLYTLRTSDKYIEATRYSTAGDGGGKDITVGTSRGGKYWYVIGLKPTGVEGIYQVLGKGTGYTNTEATLYVSYHDSCTSQYKQTLASVYNGLQVGSLVIIEWLPSNVMATTSIDVYFIAASEATADVVIKMQEGNMPMLTPVRVGYTFIGWCRNADCSDEPITTYPGYTSSDGITAITYYAKWSVD